MHEACIGFIRKKCQGEVRQVHIIVCKTHHLPTFQVVAPYQGPVLNSAFASGNMEISSCS